MLLLLGSGAALAQTSANYAIPWRVMSGGGQPSENSGGSVTLNGTIGQTAIGQSTGSGGVTGGSGYWYSIQSQTVTGIVITEIMKDPDAVSDFNGEWFELYNAGNSPVDIEGCVIKDNDSDSHEIDQGSPLIIVPGDFLILGRNGDSGANGSVTVDYEYSGFILANGADEVILECSAVEIDRVEYDDGVTFPDLVGASMQLIDPGFDNNIGANWCEAENAWSGSSGDAGSPGAANDCQPTAVTLASFTATPGDSGVTLAWETATEIDNAGFNLYRATAQAGPYVKINSSLIPAKGGVFSSGASYSYLDTAATDEIIYYYKLEDVDTSGNSTFHGPIDTTAGISGGPGSDGEIYLPLIFKERQQ